jgi:hypothetical protein
MKSSQANILRAGDYRFDIDALRRLEHRCEPRVCGESGSCCAAHDAWIGCEEHDRLVRWFSRAAEFAPHLREMDSPCRQLGPEIYVIRKRPDELCIYAFRAKYGQHLCSLHAAALECGRDPAEIKPRGCVLWPLCESGPKPPVISVQPGAYDFPCNTRREPSGTLDRGTADLIRSACGAPVLLELQDKLNALSDLPSP